MFYDPNIRQAILVDVHYAYMLDVEQNKFSLKKNVSLSAYWQGWKENYETVLLTQFFVDNKLLRLMFVKNNENAEDTVLYKFDGEDKFLTLDSKSANNRISFVSNPDGSLGYVFYELDDLNLIAVIDFELLYDNGKTERQRARWV